jgi:multimeric flavodoxin WrbA
MQEIYDKIREAENLLFVTPVYFFGLPGPLKNLVDRSQVFWNHPLPKNKRGAVVMVGEASNEKFKEFFYKTWFYILSNMGVEKFQFELMGKMTPEKKIPYSQLDEMIRFLKKENLT